MPRKPVMHQVKTPYRSIVSSFVVLSHVRKLIAHHDTDTIAVFFSDSQLIEPQFR